MPVREARLLGTLCVELSRRAALRSWTKLHGRRHSALEDLLRFAEQRDRRAEQALERMARYLGFGLAGLATGLAPEVIVVIGEMTAAWDRLGPIVLDEVKKRTLPHVTSQIVPTDPSTQPRLRGAVTLVVQQHFGAPSVA